MQTAAGCCRGRHSSTAIAAKPCANCIRYFDFRMITHLAWVSFMRKVDVISSDAVHRHCSAARSMRPEVAPTSTSPNGASCSSHQQFISCKQNYLSRQTKLIAVMGKLRWCIALCVQRQISCQWLNVPLKSFVGNTYQSMSMTLQLFRN